MSIVTLPVGLKVSTQTFGVQRFDLSSKNADTGALQTVRLGPARWTCNLVGVDGTNAQAAAVWRRMLLELQGQLNYLAVYHMKQPRPLGTARGNWTCATPALAGATSIQINVAGGVEGASILVGDWFGVNQESSQRQLLHVQKKAVITGGKLTLEFQQPLRIAVQAGAPIVWERPTCLMRQLSTTNSWTSRPSPQVGGLQNGFSLDLMEDWT